MTFQKGNKHGAGRKRGSKNKSSLIAADLQKMAIENVRQAIEAGDLDTSLALLKIILPRYKPETRPGTLDAEYLEAKIFEISEMAQRLEAIEEALQK